LEISRPPFLSTSFGVFFTFCNAVYASCTVSVEAFVSAFLCMLWYTVNAPIATRITSTATTMPPMIVCCLRSFSICSARAFIAAASAALRSARLVRFCASLLFWAIDIPFDLTLLCWAPY